jgi:hypothetical protein
MSQPKLSHSPDPASSKRLDRLKLAHDYAKWHIGLYAGSIALLISGKKEAGAFLTGQLLGVVILLLLCSAACGAMQASSILDPYRQHRFWDESAPDFWEEKVGPGRWKILRMRVWYQIEHVLFWVAATIVVGSFSINWVFKL